MPTSIAYALSCNHHHFIRPLWSTSCTSRVTREWMVEERQTEREREVVSYSSTELLVIVKHHRWPIRVHSTRTRTSRQQGKKLQIQLE